MNQDTLRLSKLLADRGICSRRTAEEWILKGWVTVDGKVHTNLAERVSSTADVNVSQVAYKKKFWTILLNKPVGYVSAQPEDGQTPAIRLLKPENIEDKLPQDFQFHHIIKMPVAGRLDIDSKGLLVFTQDGVIARKLVGNEKEIEKEYLVRVVGEITEAKIKKLCFGLSIDGEELRPARIERSNYDDLLKFNLIEGKKRQIRRMCELVDLQVTSLKRIRIGNVQLGNLSDGKWRFLGENEAF